MLSEQFRETVGRALDDLIVQGTGLAAGAVATRDGFEIAFRAHGQVIESSKLAAIAKSAGILGNTIIHESECGEKFRSVIVEADRGRIFTMEVPGTAGSLVLVAMSIPGAPFGRALLACQGCCAELGAVIEALPGFSLQTRETRIATIQDVCQKMIQNVDEAVGVAVLNLESGLPLGLAHKIRSFPQGCLDAVTAAAVEMFRGKNVLTVERLWGAQRGKELKHSIREVQMTTAETFHFMATAPGKPKALMVLITTRNANFGAGWSAVRDALATIGPSCPD